MKCEDRFGKSSIRHLVDGIRMTKTEVLQQRKELIILIRQWTGAEIMARFGALTTKRGVDFYEIMLDKEDEIRKLLFGESDLLILGRTWGML